MANGVACDEGYARLRGNFSRWRVPSAIIDDLVDTGETARTVRDQFYPKAMVQFDQVAGMPELMQDAIAFKYIPQALTREQLDELLQLPKK